MNAAQLAVLERAFNAQMFPLITGGAIRATGDVADRLCATSYLSREGKRYLITDKGINAYCMTCGEPSK